MTNLKNRRKHRIKLNAILILAGILGGFLLPCIFLFFKAFQGPDINAENASQFGSFVQGYIGTALSFISIILIVITLRHQRQSNYYEKFENKYFEMIKLHRDNLKEIGGRKLFVNLIREFRIILSEVEKIAKGSDLTKLKIFDISYSVLFYGTGPNSSRELQSALKTYKTSIITRIIEKFSDYTFKKNIKNELKLNYTPLQGNQSKLGHYYRHLYQTVCYVKNQEDLTEEEKYNYIKILRAQLSNHEQAALFLNSLSKMGENWNRKNLILEYRLIKNLPEEFFDKSTEIDIKSVYPNLVFQWEEQEQTF